MKRFYRILRTMTGVLLLLVLFCNIWFLGQRLILKKDLPKLFGYGHAIVLSGSMEPAFSAGDLLIFREQREYGPGDVIIFQHEDNLVTHRIMERTEAGFITRGDANNTADQDPVPLSMVRGRMIGVLPGVGNVIGFFSSQLGVLLLIAGGILLYELPEVRDFIREKRKGKEQ